MKIPDLDNDMKELSNVLDSPEWIEIQRGEGFYQRILDKMLQYGWKECQILYRTSPSPRYIISQANSIRGFYLFSRETIDSIKGYLQA